MKHTVFNFRNFAGLAFADFLIGSISVGFGAVDLAMIAPKGGLYVAAVGQADLIVVGLLAFFGGIVDIFAGRVAQAEGSGKTMQRLPVLGAALGLMLIAATVVGAVLALAIKPFLQLTQQDAALIPLVNDYVTLRMYAVPLALAYMAISIACRICGLKNATVAVLAGGLGLNALLNWLVLYGGFGSWAASPAQAVAATTVLSQGVMMISSLVILVVQLRSRSGRLGRLDAKSVSPEFWSMARVAPGIGVRHLNDYMGAIIPLMFIGTLGVAPVAAYVVGAKIYTLFCRVPQSCVSSAFVYYGYEVGREKAPTELRKSAHTLLRWAAIPTAIATVVFVVTAPWLVRIFGGDGLDRGLAVWMLFAFMSTVPLYLFEAAYGEILTVHQRGGLLSASSTLTTWFLMIPLAAFGVFVLRSAPVAIALGGLVSTAVLVYIFWHVLRKDHWSAETKPLVEASV